MKTRLILGGLVLTAGIIGCQTSVPVPEDAFKIASYNIRMQTEWDKGERNWSVRLPLVVKTIEQNGFDLMGLQEVTPGQLVDLDAALTGWARVGECREGGGKGEASPIYYKTARFELLSTETFALSETPAVLGSRSWETACPRICTWAKLRDKLTGKTFRYYNTHLDHKSALAEHMGMKLILQKMGDAMEGGEAVFLTGDMNVEPKSQVIALAREKLTDARDASKTAHRGSDGTFTGWQKDGWKMRIDYIFVSPGVRVLAHETVNDRFDGILPSDHDPVVATLVLP